MSAEELIDFLYEIFSEDGKEKKTTYMYLKLEEGKLKCEILEEWESDEEDEKNKNDKKLKNENIIG